MNRFADLRKAILLSLAVHLLVTFVALNIVRFNRVKFIPRQVYEVSLIEPAEVKAETPKPITPAPQQPPPEELTPEPEPEPEPNEPMPPPPEKKKDPPKKKEPKKSVPKTEPPKEPIEQPAEDQPQEPAPAETGDMSLDVEEFPFAFYIRNMKTKIASNWRVPGSAKVERTCWVSFKVDRSGRIHDVSVQTSSGDLLFDQAAQRAVLNSNPLPPLPSGFTENQLGVAFAFTYAAE